MTTNYRELIERHSPTVLRGYFGKRLMGVCALMFDVLAEGMRQATRISWVGDAEFGPTVDSLGVSGSELSLPRYPSETAAQYEARIERAWDDWPTAGHESSIISQLTAAGFPGAVIYHQPDHPGLFDLPDWSQFLVFFPAGTHGVTAPGPAWGSFSWGDGTLYGPIGLTRAQLLTMRSIIRKFKPAHYVCRGITFEISGWAYGTGHTWGEVGLVWGGTSVRIGA